MDQKLVRKVYESKYEPVDKDKLTNEPRDVPNDELEDKSIPINRKMIQKDESKHKPKDEPKNVSKEKPTEERKNSTQKRIKR